MNLLTESQIVDANVLNYFVEFDVREVVTVSYQIEIASSDAWATAVLTLYRSNDGRNWQLMSPSVVTTPGTVGFYPSTSGYDVSQTNYHKWEVTTAEGSALTLTIAPSGKGYP